MKIWMEGDMNTGRYGWNKIAIEEDMNRSKVKEKKDKTRYV